jgi:hypothetical protein
LKKFINKKIKKKLKKTFQTQQFGTKSFEIYIENFGGKCSKKFLKKIEKTCSAIPSVDGEAAAAPARRARRGGRHTPGPAGEVVAAPRAGPHAGLAGEAAAARLAGVAVIGESAPQALRGRAP